MAVTSTPHEISHFSTLHKILQRYDLQTLTQDEINFLQLYYLEAFDINQIATLLEMENSHIQTLVRKFID